MYHALPAPLRMLVASARGAYLRSWRYGAETETLVQEALARDWWTAEHWQSWQRERLAAWLHRAATQVPFYRRYWSSRAGVANRTPWEELTHWPILEKSFLRDTPTAFLTEGQRPGSLFAEHTSGTTGTPMSLWRDRLAMRQWYSVCEARFLRWYGVSRHDRWAIMGGQLVAPFQQTTPPFWVWNAGLKQLYLSVYHLKQAYLPHYMDALRRYRVKYIYCYPSAVYALAKWLIQTGQAAPDLDVIITNAEPLFNYQREAVERAFNCPVRETYGMSEMVLGASECDAGRMHLWPEVGVPEILDAEGLISPTGTGELLSTGLMNGAMPLVRYRVGDRVRLTHPAAPCACKRGLPILDAIDGREDDVLITPDGRVVGRLDHVFKADLPIVEAQLIQDSAHRVRVRFIPDCGYDATAEQALVSSLQSRLGPMDFVFEPLQEIPRTKTGKFRAVVRTFTPGDPL